MKNNMNYIFRRVLTFFIIFVILSFIKGCEVKAESVTINLDDTATSVKVPLSGNFYNYTSNNATYVTTNNDGITLYSDDFTTTATGYGGIIAFSTDEVLKAGYIYSISVYLGAEGGIGLKPSDQNNYLYVCTSFSTCTNNVINYSTHAQRQYLNWVNTRVSYQGSGSTLATVITYLVVIDNSNYNYIAIPFSTNSNHTASKLFYGYSIVELGKNDLVTNASLNSAISNSGLATANSVTQVQTAITNMQTSISNSIDAQSQQQHQDSLNTQNAINNVNSSINNDNIDSADSKASEWANKSLSDNAVANMVTMPITLLQAYLNGLNGTCSSFSLGTLYEHELILPCINLSSYFGSTIWSVIDILFSGFMIYAIGKKFVKIFNDFTNLKDNQVNELYGGGN